MQQDVTKLNITYCFTTDFTRNRVTGLRINTNYPKDYYYLQQQWNPEAATSKLKQSDPQTGTKTQPPNRKQPVLTAVFSYNICIVLEITWKITYSAQFRLEWFPLLAGKGKFVSLLWKFYHNMCNSKYFIQKSYKSHPQGWVQVLPDFSASK